MPWGVSSFFIWAFLACLKNRWFSSIFEWLKFPVVMGIATFIRRVKTRRPKAQMPKKPSISKPLGRIFMKSPRIGDKSGNYETRSSFNPAPHNDQQTTHIESAQHVSGLGIKKIKKAITFITMAAHIHGTRRLWPWRPSNRYFKGRCGWSENNILWIIRTEKKR